jgi:hypothetical protein
MFAVGFVVGACVAFLVTFGWAAWSVWRER